jgi:CheY-like chemotaxis protein
MVARHSLNGISVLIVDDNHDARYVLEATLQYAGALAIVAESGKEALAQLAQVRVDVIVSDISMPGFSGHDFIRAVRQLPAPTGDTPAIAVTAFDEEGQRGQAVSAGFNVYLVKPVDQEILAREIARLGRRAA